MELPRIFVYVVSSIGSVIFAVFAFPFSTHNVSKLTIPFIVNSDNVFEKAPLVETWPSVTFHKRIQTGKNTSFEIRQIPENGTSVHALKIPKEGDPSLKNGYLTYSNQPEYYIYYPRLGSEIIYFDTAGEKLWEKTSHHYMEIFPDGKYILGLAGDSSRAFIFDPDLNEIANVEGMIMLGRRFMHDPSEKFDLCLGFLNGEIVFIDVESGKKRRLQVAENLTSLACNSSPLRVFYQSGTKTGEGERLTLVTGLAPVFHDESNDTSDNTSDEEQTHETLFQINLGRYYSSSLPMQWHDNYGVILTPEKNDMQALVFDRQGVLLDQIALPMTGNNTDDWRSIKLKNGIVFWSSETVLVFDKHLIYRAHSEIKNAKGYNNHFFLDTYSGIVAFRLSK
ncbi:MAG: hypothetical protein ABUK01_11365 [Leptospirales bacterium]